MSPRLVAVVPVFNEAPTVGVVVERLRGVCPVIVVDDASTDGSGARAAAAGAACIIRRGRRLGKGAALRAGFAEALSRGAEAVATLDGDGQHDPADLPRLLAAAAGAPQALIVANRLDRGGGDRVPLLRRAAILVADRCLRWLTRAPVQDTQCGFRIYPATFLRTVTLRGERFVLETEALVAAVRLGHPLLSVPVRAIYPRGRQSRFRAVADAACIAWYLAHEAVGELVRRVTGEPLARRPRLSVPASQR